MREIEKAWTMDMWMVVMAWLRMGSVDLERREEKAFLSPFLRVEPYLKVF